MSTGAFGPYDNFKKAAAEAAAAKPDGALICGDVARLEGMAGDYDNVKALSKPLMDAAPVAFVMGNHDNRKNFLAAFGAGQKGAQNVARQARGGAGDGRCAADCARLADSNERHAKGCSEGHSVPGSTGS